MYAVLYSLWYKIHSDCWLLGIYYWIMQNLMDQFHFNSANRLILYSRVTTIYTAVRMPSQPTPKKIGLYIIFKKIHSNLFDDDDDKRFNCSKGYSLYPVESSNSPFLGWSTSIYFFMLVFMCLGCLWSPIKRTNE